MRSKKVSQEYIDTIQDYLSKNRSYYGSPLKVLRKLPNNKTIYGNEHGKFAMSDGNSIYLLNKSLEEVMDQLIVPDNAIEYSDFFKLYSAIHLLNGIPSSSTIKAINPILEQAREEGLLTNDLLDSLEISDRDYSYTTTIDVFEMSNTLYFTREQIDLYRRLLGTESKDYQSWTSDILSGESERGKAYVYTRKSDKQI